MVPDNRAILDIVAKASAHGDLTAVVARVAGAIGGLRLVDLHDAPFAAVVGTAKGANRIVVAAWSQSALALRVGREPPEARLSHELAGDLGPGWWLVNPFDPEVSIPDTEADLRRWFTAARDA